METPTLETLETHIEDYLGKADSDRNESQIADVQTMARSIKTRYKLKSPEEQAITKFIKDLDALRRKRFPKKAKPTLRELPEENSIE